MEQTKTIIKVKKPDGKVQLMEAKSISRKEKVEDKDVDLKILGLVMGFGNSHDDFYIGQNSKGEYFLLVGRRATPPENSFLFNDFPDYEDMF